MPFLLKVSYPPQHLKSFWESFTWYLARNGCVLDRTIFKKLLVQFVWTIWIRDFTTEDNLFVVVSFHLGRKKSGDICSLRTWNWFHHLGFVCQDNDYMITRKKNNTLGIHVFFQEWMTSPTVTRAFRVQGPKSIVDLIYVN